MSSTPLTVEPIPVELGEQILRYLGLAPDNIETRALVLLCERYRLDPLLGHASVIVTKNGPKPYITRDGMIEIAHRSGQLDGIVVDEERRSSTGDGWTAYVSVWRKDAKHPFKYGAQCKDTEQQAKLGNGPEMALARAERRALRRAFRIPAYDELADTDIDVRGEDNLSVVDSADRERSALGSASEVTDSPDAEPAPKALTDETRAAIAALFSKVNITEGADQLAFASNALGRDLDAPGRMTEDEGEQLLAALRRRAEAPR